MRVQLDEVRNQLVATKVAHLKQIEQMEGEELLAQKQLRTEMIQLEDQLSQVMLQIFLIYVNFETLNIGETRIWNVARGVWTKFGRQWTIGAVEQGNAPTFGQLQSAKWTI